MGFQAGRYQVDAGDGDPATVLLLSRDGGGPGRKGKHKALPLLTPELQQDLDGFSRRYFRELFARLPERALLVLDNAQEAPAESSFQSILESFVEEIPETVNVAVHQPPDPPSAFARYASTGRLATLAMGRLRLTLDETRQIAAVKQPIEERTLLRLFEQSEGWAAGVTLMLERMTRTGDVPEAIEAKRARRCSTTSPGRCSTSNRPIPGRCCFAPPFSRRSRLLWRKVSPAIQRRQAARASAPPPPVHLSPPSRPGAAGGQETRNRS